jgi:hypothetical protein
MNSDAFKIIIVITTFDRPNLLLNLIKEFKKQSRDIPHVLSFVIYNDGSSEDYTEVRKELDDTNHIYLMGKKNKGKKGYWKTINATLKAIKRNYSDWNYAIYVGDNFVIVNDFFIHLFGAWFRIQDQKKGALNIVRDYRSFSEIWGNDYWIDGKFMIRNECLRKLNFKVYRIPKSRWRKNKLTSSGVWRQISERLVKLGYRLYHIDESLAVRVHPFESKMNPEIRRKEAHFSLNVKGGSIDCPTCYWQGIKIDISNCPDCGFPLN